MALQRDVTFRLRRGGSELRWSKDLHADSLCGFCQDLLPLNRIRCGPDRANHNVDTLKGRHDGGQIVVIDGGKLGTLRNPFRVRCTRVLEVRKYGSSSQKYPRGGREVRTDRETTITEETVPTTFNLRNSSTIKLPIFPAPTTAKERKTIQLFVGEKRSRGGDHVLPMDPVVR